MVIKGVNTITSGMKKLTLEPKPQERRQNISKTSEGSSQIDELKRWSADQRRSQAISSIYGKMMSGSYLTKDELQYLQENSPDNYEKAMQIMKERELYKKELENCKSKEDVQKLNLRKTNQLAAEAQSISTNSNIPKGEKKEMLEFVTMRMSAIMNDHTAFISSDQYRQLPDKSEELTFESENAVDIVSPEETIDDFFDDSTISIKA